MTIRVILADDEPLVRAGIGMLLSAHSDIELLAEAPDGAQAIVLAQSMRPDVVVMDVRMPGVDGITATRVLVEESAQYPDHLAKVLVLTTFNDDEVVYGALRSGASGFLLKHAAPQDLVTAVRRVAGGEVWIDPAVARKVIDAMAGEAQRNLRAPELLSRLTAREQEVLTLMAQGMNNLEISERLFLSAATVKTHVARVVLKTGSQTRTGAVVLAYQSGLVEPRRR